jgi:hypothetical protein
MGSISDRRLALALVRSYLGKAIRYSMLHPAGSRPVVIAVSDLGQEDHFLAGTIMGIAYVEDVEPVAVKVTLELIAFAKAQGRGRSHDLLTDGGRSLKGYEWKLDLGHGT